MTKHRAKRNIFYFIQFCVLLFGVSFPFWQSREILHIYSPLWVILPGVLFMILFALAFGTAFNFRDNIARKLKKVIGYWLGGGFILFFTLILFLVVNIPIGIPREWVVGSALAVSNTLIIYSYHHGKRIVTKTLSFHSGKINQRYQFVHLSDIHVGSNKKEEVERIVHHLEKLSFDFVVITGDLIDEDFASKHDLEPLNKIKEPIYYITGNHEYYLRKKSFRDFLQKTNIDDINDKKVSFKEIDIYGIDEKSDIGEVLDTLDVEKERYSLCLMHEPKSQQLKKASARGIDLLLSGHTHNGQIYPFTLMVKARYPFMRGVYEINNMSVYVSQGAGTWGPKMRLGTSNEITLIMIGPLSK